MYTGIRRLLLICPFIFSCFLSNFQTLNIFITLFSQNVRPSRLKLGTHVDNGQVYRVYRNQAAAAYSSFYFSIFVLSNFQTLNIFRHTFLRNCKVLKVETWCTRGQWVNVSYIPESGGGCIFVALFFHFFSNFQTLKCFFHTFLRNCEA